MKESEHEKTMKDMASKALSSIGYSIYHWVDVRNMDVLGGSQSILVEWVWDEESKKYLPSDRCLSMILATGILANYMTDEKFLEWKANNEFVREQISEEIHRRFWKPSQSQKIRMSNIIEKPAC